jgi:hypothetical protein
VANAAHGKAKTNGGPTSGSAPATGNDPVLLEIKDISVVIPQRKKYTLCFTSTHLYARLPDSEEPVPGISYAWADIGMFAHPSTPGIANKGNRIRLFSARARKIPETAQLYPLSRQLKFSA